MPPYDTIIGLQNGFDAVCAFCDLLGGATVYIPNKRTVFQRCLEMEALKEFDGSNFREVRIKYGFSERHLRNVFNHRDY